MGITASGVEVITEEQYFNTMLSDYKLVFPEMSTSPSNMLVILARIWARNENRRDYDLVELYNNLFVSYATGKNLDRIVGTAGISRSAGLNANGTVEIISTSTDVTDYTKQVILAPNEKFKIGDNIYSLDEDNIVVFPSPSNQVLSMELKIVSDEKGAEYNLKSGSNLNIITPKLYIKSIQVKDDITGGENRENDSDLRERYYERMNTYNNSSLIGIMDKVKQIIGVKRVDGLENSTEHDMSIPNAPQGSIDTLSPHSFIIYVNTNGLNLDSEIGEAILRNKPTGIKALGDKEVKVNILQREWTIHFSEFNPIDLHFSIIVNPKAGSNPIGAKEEIKNALSEYASEHDVISKYDITVWLAQKIDWIGGFDKFNFGIGNATDEADVTITTGNAFVVDINDDAKTEVIIGGIA